MTNILYSLPKLIPMKWNTKIRKRKRNARKWWICKWRQNLIRATTAGRETVAFSWNRFWSFALMVSSSDDISSTHDISSTQNQTNKSSEHIICGENREYRICLHRNMRGHWTIIIGLRLTLDEQSFFLSCNLNYFLNKKNKSMLEQKWKNVIRQ